jgi:PilZ domain
MLCENSRPMPERRTQRYHFMASAEVLGLAETRTAKVETLSVLGAFLSMAEPFEKGMAILVKIRTPSAFFQSQAKVAYADHGIGMGVEFVSTQPAFRTVLQEWLLGAVPKD